MHGSCLKRVNTLMLALSDEATSLHAMSCSASVHTRFPDDVTNWHAKSSSASVHNRFSIDSISHSLSPSQMHAKVRGSNERETSERQLTRKPARILASRAPTHPRTQYTQHTHNTHTQHTTHNTQTNTWNKVIAPTKNIYHITCRHTTEYM
jgi:hypothetical protein